MPSRRPLMRRVLALATGGTALGSTLGTATAADDRTTSSDRRSTGSRSSADRSLKHTPYDASIVADGDTVITATVDPSVVSTTGLPVPWADRLLDAQRRADGVSISDVTRLTGSAVIDEETVEGGAVARGSFDTDAVVTAVTERVGPVREHADGSLRRVVGVDDPFALAVDDSEVVVGYGPDADRAVEHVDAALERGTRHEEASANYGSLPSGLEGDAVVYADLGRSGRERVRPVLADAPDALSTAVSAAGAVGIALRARQNAPARLRYGAVADPKRLTRDRVERLAAEAERGADSLDETTITRRGRTVVVDAVADDDSLLAAHADLVGESVDATRDVDVA
ncbi:hypothetical protein J2751_002062 [Halorubrum alkaliphilum]|uniref:Uncharacterized protein n=1 Tax=Halorubrum alkaliphilum TaxID=261290 RepID=A0A8T4GJ38_9EURY|nr:hypothetical protein [Halorubrum alkaliphilum]MBP1923025.1 hypothetical protein [Halorubrum alkaliphilum]